MTTDWQPRAVGERAQRTHTFTDADVQAFADLMVVGDLFEILPRLTEAIRARKSGKG